MKLYDRETSVNVLSMTFLATLVVMIGYGLYWYAFEFFPRKKRAVPEGPIYTEQYLQKRVDEAVEKAMKTSDWSACLSLPSSVKYFSTHDPIQEHTGRFPYNDFTIYNAQDWCINTYLKKTFDVQACNFYKTSYSRSRCQERFSKT
jgi:hypothetical protein